MPENQIEWVKSPHGVVEVYANLTHITWSLDDVRIRLAQVVDSPNTPTPSPNFVAVAEERGCVTLSWRNAKNLKNQLSRLIEDYERVNGEIILNLKLAGATDTATTKIQ